MQCAVEMDLTRYQRSEDAAQEADFAYDRECVAARAHADKVLADESNWTCAPFILTSRAGVPYCTDEVLRDALEADTPEVAQAFAALITSPQGAAMREALVQHWLDNMWEDK